jgi:hypothetical protein
VTLCGRYFSRSLQRANAIIPTYPMATGTIPGTQSMNTITVPGNKTFVIVTAVNHLSGESNNEKRTLSIFAGISF